MKFTHRFLVVSLFLLPLLSTAQDNILLRKYAGTYHLLADGQPVPETPDQYVLTADGKGVWTMTFKNQEGKLEVKKTPGTWKASEGFIQTHFTMGEGEDSELATDFHLKDGVFRANGGIYLKKVVASSKSPSQVVPKTAPKK